ncbi:MAG: M48 family metalloprotease [Planctomycetaceae bacterium]|nr:M48 family metalloprotease [Planctomycetaceae bacterium]
MMIAIVEEYVVLGLAWCVIAAWRAVPLVAIVLVADWLLGRRMAARFQCVLWTLVILRLGVAVTVPAPFSVHGPWDRMAAALISPEPADTAQVHVVTAGGESFTMLADDPVVPAATVASAPVFATPHDTPQMATSAWSWEEWLAFTFVSCWLLVVVGMSVRAIVQYARFSVRLRRCPEIAEQTVIDHLLRVCDQLGCRRRPEIKQTDMVDVPAVFGLWRPVICLPQGMMESISDEDLRLVMKHEVAHVVRRDALVLTLAGIVRAAQWFNPLAWLAFARLRSSIERAADERALRGEPRRTLRQYGELLLKFGTGGVNHQQPASVGLLFMSARRRLSDRISGLDTMTVNNSWRARTLGAAVAVLIAAMGLFDGVEADDTVMSDEQRWQQLPPLPEGQPLQPLPAQKQKLVQHTYDVSAALATLQQKMGGTPQQREQHLAALFIHDQQLPEIVDGMMTVHEPADAESGTRSMLAAIARTGTVQIKIDCRAIHAGLDVAEDFDWILPDGREYPGESAADSPWLQSPQAPLPDFPDADTLSESVLLTTTEHNVQVNPGIRMKISDFQRRLLLRRCQSSAKSNIMQAPRVTLFNGQQAAITDSVQRPFVVGLEPQKKHGKMALQPVIRVFDDGWKLRLSPAATEDGGVDLRCVITESQVTDVKVVDLPVPDQGAGREQAVVQAPSVRERHIQSVVHLQPGESLLIASPEPRSPDSPAEKTMARYYLLTPTIIEDPSLPESRPVDSALQNPASNDDSRQSP